MKSGLFMVIPIIAVSIGCDLKHQQDAARVSALEDKIRQLESQLAEKGKPIPETSDESKGAEKPHSKEVQKAVDELEKYFSEGHSLDEIRSGIAASYDLLRRVNSACELGLNYPQYSNILISVKPDFETAISKIPTFHKVRPNLENAFSAHIAAHEFWGISIQSGKDYIDLSYPRADRYQKYGLKLSGSIAWRQQVREFWDFAGTELHSVQKFIESQKK